MATNSVSGLANDYANLRTIPALLSVVFIAASLYQFGGIAEIALQWGLNYTLTPEHATIVSLFVLVVAFASSETKALEYYEGWEKALIAAAPVLILSHQYVDWVSQQFTQNDPHLAILAFLLCAVSWGVAVR